jgi:hypothetical protein
MSLQSATLEAARQAGTARRNDAAGVVTGAPRAILRLEAAAVLIAAVACYAYRGGDWVLFALLFLVPDVSMLGYFAGRQVGALTYNVGHSYLGPAILSALGILAARHAAVDLALIWIAHIGFDRTLGYGLKYTAAFGHTHLGLKGKLSRQT